MPFVIFDPKYKYLCKNSADTVFVCTMKPTKTQHSWRDKGEFMNVPIMIGGPWDECLYEITYDTLIKIEQRPDLAVDTPVLVSGDEVNWYKKHFKKWSGKKIEVFRDGRTSFTEFSCDRETWSHWKLP